MTLTSAIAPSPGAQIHLSPKPLFPNAYVNVLSTYLDSRLIIEYAPGMLKMESEGYKPAVTHMKFCDDQAGGGTIAFIQLTRDGKQLELNPLRLPHEQDRVNILFRAAATAAGASHTGNKDTPAASDDDTHLLRRAVLATFGSGFSIAPSFRETAVPDNWDIDDGDDIAQDNEIDDMSIDNEADAMMTDSQSNAGFLEIQAMAARYDREQIDLAIRAPAIEESIAISMANIRDCRRHNTSPIAFDALETEAKAAPQPAAPCRQGKRRLSNESTEIMPPPKRHDNANTSNR